MAFGDQYRIKAADLRAWAQSEANPRIRVEFENLSKAYLRLAEQADRNSHLDVTYEPPPPRLGDLERKR